MQHPEQDEYESYWHAQEARPTATPSSCLASLLTAGLALLSMGGGAVVSMLALGTLLQRVPDTMGLTLQLAALPLAFSLLLRGFACQALVAFFCFALQFHQQVRAIMPGMLLVGVVASLLLLLQLTAS